MSSNGATYRGSLATLALKVAEELDKALRGEAPDPAVANQFAASLAGGTPSPVHSMFLHNHRTIGAFSRAWERAYHSRLETVHELNERIPEKVQEAGQLLVAPRGVDMKKKEEMMEFFLSLNQELLLQQFPSRPARPPAFDWRGQP